MDKNYYTLKEAAEKLNSNEQAVRRAADRGQIKFFRTLGGWRRFPVHEIHKLIENNPQIESQPTT